MIIFIVTAIIVFIVYIFFINRKYHDYKNYTEDELLYEGEAPENNVRNKSLIHYLNKKYPLYSPHYASGCWKCKSKINSNKNIRCNKCGWLVCTCGKCSYHCSVGNTLLISVRNELDVIRNLPQDDPIKIKAKQIIHNRKEKYCLKYGLEKYNESDDLLSDYEQRIIRENRDKEEKDKKEKERLEREEFRRLEDELGVERGFMIIPEYHYETIDDLKNLIAIKRERDKLEAEKWKLKEREKYEKSFQYVIDEYFKKDQCLISAKDLSFKGEVAFNIKKIDINETENYLRRIIDLCQGFVVSMRLLCNDNQLNMIMELDIKKIQKKTKYSNLPGEVNLLIER
jgi:hypothetical protein